MTLKNLRFQCQNNGQLATNFSMTELLKTIFLLSILASIVSTSSAQSGEGLGHFE